MITRTFDGQLFLTLHQPNKTLYERAAFHALREMEDTLVLDPARMLAETAEG